MPVLALIIAIIGGIGVWWWRAQQVKGAADAALDAAGKARGSPRPASNSCGMQWA